MKESYIVLGSGGVGKTTVAAALGMALASPGKKGALFTVDPSLRLCQTLGLEKLSLEASYLEDNRLEAYGLEVQDGIRILLQKIIKDSTKVERILKHRLFSLIQGNISHLDHFLAMEKIVELLERTDLDFLVIDTPPHDQAFEFFESPKVLANFLDKAFLKTLLETKVPAEGIIGKIIGKAVDEGWRIFRSLLGESFWQELAGLLHDLLPLRARLLESTLKLDSFLKNPSTQAVLVTVPERRPFEVAVGLAEDWSTKLQLQVHGLVLNRAFPADLILPSSLEGTLFYQRYLLQKEISQSDLFRSFERVHTIKPLSPLHMNVGDLKEMGHGLMESVRKNIKT